MGIIERWKEARGNVMRKEYQDLALRLRNANEQVLEVIQHQIRVVYDETLETYKLASDRERKKFLKDLKKVACTMWDRGDWPFAMGTMVVCFNAESLFLPGDDAAYVKSETGKIIAEALKAEAWGSSHEQRHLA